MCSKGTPSNSLCFFIAFAFWACSGLHASCYLTPRWEEKPPSLVTSFLSFTLVSFLFSSEFRVLLSLSFATTPLSPSSARVCDRLKTSTSHNSASSANAQDSTRNNHWTFSQCPRLHEEPPLNFQPMPKTPRGTTTELSANAQDKEPPLNFKPMPKTRNRHWTFSQCPRQGTATELSANAQDKEPPLNFQPMPKTRNRHWTFTQCPRQGTATELSANAQDKEPPLNFQPMPKTRNRHWTFSQCPRQGTATELSANAQDSTRNNHWTFSQCPRQGTATELSANAQDKEPPLNFQPMPKTRNRHWTFSQCPRQGTASELSANAQDKEPPLNFQPISNLGKPPFCKDYNKRESLYTKVQTPDFSWAGVINIHFSLIKKLNARVKEVIDGCSGLCNCTYFSKLGISHFHSLKLTFSSLSLYLHVTEWMRMFPLS